MASFSPLGISFEYPIKQSSAVGSCHSESDLFVSVDLAHNFNVIKPGSYKPASIVKNRNKTSRKKKYFLFLLRAPHKTGNIRGFALLPLLSQPNIFFFSLKQTLVSDSGEG